MCKKYLCTTAALSGWAAKLETATLILSVNLLYVTATAILRGSDECSNALDIIQRIARWSNRASVLIVAGTLSAKVKVTLAASFPETTKECWDAPLISRSMNDATDITSGLSSIVRPFSRFDANEKLSTFLYCYRNNEILEVVQILETRFLNEKLTICYPISISAWRWISVRSEDTTLSPEMSSVEIIACNGVRISWKSRAVKTSFARAFAFSCCSFSARTVSAICRSVSSRMKHLKKKKTQHCKEWT